MPFSDCDLYEYHGEMWTCPGCRKVRIGTWRDRCGACEEKRRKRGQLMRCTCDQAVIEALEEVARWCGERADFEWADPNRAWAYGRVREHVRDMIDKRLAQPKG